jgi:signal transduction histidine kinase/ActR/RegA family two-component response regulator
MAVSLLEGRPIRGEEIVVERPDGERRWILPHPQPLRDAAGTITGAVNMLVDITDRKRAEEELRVLGRQLQEKVEALAEADHRKNEFLATLAHELRNPLAPIRYSLELLERADDDPKIRREARGTMERQLRQMVRLVDDLLDVSRLSNNKLRLMKEPLELGPVLDSALEAARPFIEGAGHQLVVERPSEPVHVHGDSTRLAQVFGNLLHNAAKFTPEGGRVSVAVEPGRGEVVVRVGDTGVGIASRHLPRLFEMFSQATPTLERSEEGLGIGLALVRALVELHEGSVEARSAGPGQGSEFVVRLPTCEPLAAHTTGATIARELFVRAPKRRVLIADDNPDSVDALGTLLELEGHEVAIAHDGHEALELAAGFLPEVVLLDIGMPGLNGYETARRMREASWSNDLVLVAITGWGQEADKQRAREAGFDYHLTKPVDAADLESLLASVPPRERPFSSD